MQAERDLQLPGLLTCPKFVGREEGVELYIIKSINYYIDCLEIVSRSPFQGLFYDYYYFEPLSEHTCYYGINFSSREENKDGQKRTEQMLGFISQREGVIYENKQITAQSAVGTVKLSPQKRCRKNNSLQNCARFRFRTNSGFQVNEGLVCFLVLLIYIHSI